tara:strand:+ start:1765 stop:2070 length:306 start_codon:yes stop_codon:yes gene_type:complete
MEDLKTIGTFPYFHNFTASSNTTQITIPKGCRKVSIGSEDKKLYYCRNGATDGGSLPSNYSFVPKDNMVTISMGRGRNIDYNLYVCSSSGSATVSIVLQEE